MRALALVAFASTAPLLHAGNVHVVGGPASTAPDIQTAVNAAADGDVVLVRANGQSGFVVDGKSLSIIAEPAGATIASRVEIRNVNSSQSVALRGLAISYGLGPALHVHDCSGHVRVDDCQVSSLAGSGGPKHGLFLSNCADVALENSLFRGAPGILTAQNAGSGMLAQNSYVNADACFFLGGQGLNGGFSGTLAFGAQAGAAGIELGGSQLALRSSSTTGGPGGSGTPGTCCCPFPHAAGAGATGGAGITSSTPVVVTLLSSSTLGGAGGNGGSGAGCTPTPVPPGAPGAPGADVGANTTIVTLPDPVHSVFADALTREQSSLGITAFAPAGETATLLLSTTCQLNSLPGIGDVLVGPGFRRIPLGVVPGTGVLNASLPIGDLLPGVQASPRFLQLFFRDAGGNVRLSGCTSVALLDAAF